MKTLIFILIQVSFISSLYSQSAWFWQNPVPTGNQMRNVDFINSNTGFAIGDYNEIIKTTNSGASWQLTNGYSPVELWDLKALSNGIVIVVGHNGNILRSSDFGTTWSKINTLITAELYGVNFYNLSTGFIVGQFQTILKTTNGGMNWQTINNTGTSIYFDITFPSPTTHYISGSSGSILKSTNGGTNWITQFTSTANSFRGIHFLDTLNGFAAGSIAAGNILRTTNGGLNWFDHPVGTLNLLADVKFYDNLTGFVLTNGGGSSAVMKTTDGGIFWNNASTVSGFSFRFLDVIDQNNLKAGGEVSFKDARLYSSLNGGTNWVELPHRQGFRGNIWSTKYIGNNVQLSVGDSGKIFRSTNNGASWSTIISGTLNQLRGIQFLNPNTGYVSGKNGILLKTTNSGLSWFALNPPAVVDLHNTSFFNENTGFAIGRGAYKTTNGGTSWVTSINQGGAETLRVAHFMNLDTGLIAGSSLKRTTNGGLNWYVPGPSELSRHLSFANSNTGIIVLNSPGSSSYIYRSTDCGLNFNSVILPDTGILYSSCFVSPSTFYVVGEKGTVMRSTDLGISWSVPQFVATEHNLYAVDFANALTGTIAGARGTIKGTTTGGVITAIDPVLNAVPETFMLHQNYPNPFNPVTTIRYDIPQSSVVSLKVYDINGRELAVIENGYKTAGSYSITFDGSSLSSGVYFYKLTANEFSEVKRMVLLK